MDKSITRVLKIKNKVEPTEIKIEDCSEYSDVLNGYNVVLDSKNISDVKSFLLKDYKTFESEIIKGFNSYNDDGTTSGILKVLEIYKDGGSYTEAILEVCGGIESVLGVNIVKPMNEVDSDNASNDDSNDDSTNEEVGVFVNANLTPEEEEEMYKELYNEIRQEFDQYITEKEAEINSIKTELEDLTDFKEAYSNVDRLEYSDVDMIVDILQNMDSSDHSNILFDLIAMNADKLINDPSYNVDKLPVLTILMNQIAECLDSSEEQGE